METNLGATIKELRKKRKLSQVELAKRAYTSQTYLSGIESGKRIPSIGLLELIGIELEVPYQIILFMSLSEDAIPVNKKRHYRQVFPAINAMIKTYFLT